MVATRPWWHEMEGGRAAERAPAAAATGRPPRPPDLPDLSDHRLARYDAERSPPPSLTGGVITRKVVEWDPGSPAREWVRRVTHDGRALAIRREQDARRGLASRSLGITPLVRHEPAPRVRTAPRPSSLSGAAPDRAITTNRNAWGAASGALGHSLQPPRAAGLAHALATHPMSARAATLPPPPPTGPLRPGTNPFPGPFVPAPPRRPSSTERGGGAAAPAAHMPDLPGGHVTFCGPTAPPPLFAAMPSGTGVQAASARRAGTSTAPAVTCTVPSGRASAPDRLRGKGSKHARLCGGPWIAALDYLPPLPLTGAKRARAGLAAVPLASEDIDKIRRERSARALVAILPWSAAGFILGDSDAMVAARSPEETTARLIRALAAYGVSSVDAAQSALGRLVSWVVVHRPDALTVEGSHVSDFLEYERPSTATLTALAWLRDHCGLAIPARGPVCRAFRGRPPTAPRSKESMSLGVVVGLEHLAAHHHSKFVRGQAAGWTLLARLALRVEQAQSCVINAFTTHEFAGEVFTLIVGSVQHDKHPDPSKRRPRPIWGVIDGLDEPACLRVALHEMLEDVEQSRFLIRDTDSPDGDPLRASTWVAAPLRGATRVNASLQALLRLPPTSLSAEEASRYHGHSAKRFLLNVAEASGSFSPVEACEVGRFSLSTAQAPDLEPVAAMLRAHSMRAAVLPDIYAGKAKVARVFDLLAKNPPRPPSRARRASRRPLPPRDRGRQLGVVRAVLGWTTDPPAPATRPCRVS